jgi:hypothetical protein
LWLPGGFFRHDTSIRLAGSKGQEAEMVDPATLRSSRQLSTVSSIAQVVKDNRTKRAFVLSLTKKWQISPNR